MIGERTARNNQARSILLERRIVVPMGKRHLEEIRGVLLIPIDGAP